MKKIILLTLISFTFTACSSTSKTPLSPEEKAEAEYKKNYTEVASHTIKTRSGNLTVIDRIHNSYSDDTTASSMNLMIIRKSNTVKARAAQTAVFTATFALLILARNSNHIGYEGPDLLDKHNLSGKPIKPNFANPILNNSPPKFELGRQNGHLKAIVPIKNYLSNRVVSIWFMKNSINETDSF